MLRVQSRHTDAQIKVYISVVLGSPLPETSVLPPSHLMETADLFQALRVIRASLSTLMFGNNE